MDNPTSKIMRLNDDVSQSIFQTSFSQTKSSVALKEPLQGGLQEVFRMFQNITNRDGYVSQQTYFIFHFVKLLVVSGKSRSVVVLQALPNSLIPYLLRALPELFSSNLLLKLYDVNSISGRNNIARDLCMLRNFSLRNSTISSNNNNTK